MRKVTPLKLYFEGVRNPSLSVPLFVQAETTFTMHAGILAHSFRLGLLVFHLLPLTCADT